MASRHIHVISFDIPYPPSYGGVIDVYYKIKSLFRAGIKVHLHCFEYGRERNRQLNKICESVNYYPRSVSRSMLFNSLPYIIITRSSDLLLKRLSLDHHPILMEGLHSSFYLNAPELKGRFMIVRTHNVEHDYYNGLAKVEGNIFKRYYFYNEATKLENYEKCLAKASMIAAISPADVSHFKSKFEHVVHLPPFHPHEKLTIRPGKGKFVLYHGNLSVGENNEAALYLVNNVFSELKNISFVVAGNKPSKELKALIAKKRNITLHADMDMKTVQELIKEAHINILPTFQPTGIKLKLVTALFSGRHCLVNPEMVAHTELESLCHIEADAKGMVGKIKDLFHVPFTEEMAKEREQLLKKYYSNKSNVDRFIEQVFVNR